jgi:hydrogenase expression/formation protein HypE
MKNILLGHGSGGKLSDDLIKDVFINKLGNSVLSQLNDSATLRTNNEIAFTTDSFVVDPIFFSGGDIGKLAVCGTVNDLAVAGATPRYLSLSVILEEGFAIDQLEKIVESIAVSAKEAEVKIVTGDTKVVNRGKCDKIFINTAGIGDYKNNFKSETQNINIGDKILINGDIADHGLTVMLERNEMDFSSDISSDCAPLNGLISELIDAGIELKFMRDATRGGIATVLSEISEQRNLSIRLEEDKVPVKESVRGMCEFLGFDPMYVANKGKVITVVGNSDSEKALEIMKRHKYGKNASIIGEVVARENAGVILNTVIGGSRIIDKITGEQLPRIC